MARANTRTKLPLDTWAELMGINPLHFSQVRIGSADPHCDQLIFQYAWQNQEHVSREEIAQAIADAETKIESYLGYRLCPSWEVDEWVATERPFVREHVSYMGSDIRGFNQVVPAKWGYFISGGIQAKDLVEADVPITYEDVDGDGYAEKATVTTNTVARDKNEICLFYPEKDGDDAWEIRPIEVSINGSGVATITFKRHQAVVPEKLDALFDIEGAEAIGEDDDDFLEVVDIYRRYNDPQSQVSFLWEPFAGGWCGECSGAGCSRCAYATQTGCLLLRGDPRNSLVAMHPADWDSEEQTFTNVGWNSVRTPDIARLYYYAGWRKKDMRYNNRMDPQWERAVAYMASAMLDRPPCSCSTGQWDKWKQDLAILPVDEVRRVFYGTSSDIDNPFGSKLGEVEAWRLVKRLAIGEGVRT